MSDHRSWPSRGHRPGPAGQVLGWLLVAIAVLFYTALALAGAAFVVASLLWAADLLHSILGGSS